ncbi:MAG: DUF3299 domain-containing protein [Roseateles depolymerans]|uniref:DUF3299 domain-containing protein n=1 Tax=Roseateles depolymerans TaxID=76731 RepID=A0A2W5FXR6_9BURK|nr:MAG: DUF3299 domain-containing protein [Roseateles depolymerans]
MTRRATLHLLGWGAAVGAGPLAVWLTPKALPGAAAASAPSGDPDLLAWAELLPPGWAQALPPRPVATGTRLDDNDPRAARWLHELAQARHDAPLRTALDQRRVALQGYVVPLELAWRGLAEFLLVPYFGACIHSPPPPPNQIVRVQLREPQPGLRAMDRVQVRGRLTVQRHSAGGFDSGYLLQADQAEPLSAAR